MTEKTTEAKAPEAPQEEPQAAPETPETAPPAPEVKETPKAPETAVQGVSPEELAAVAKTAEEATAKAAQLELELNRERVARKYNVPEELMGMLRPDSLEADAKALQTHAATKSTGLGAGGLDPTDNDDPVTEGKTLVDRLFARRNPFS